MAFFAKKKNESLCMEAASDPRVYQEGGGGGGNFSA